VEKKYSKILEKQKKERLKQQAKLKKERIKNAKKARKFLFCPCTGEMIISENLYAEFVDDD
jgi:peroxiredoxin family protein